MNKFTSQGELSEEYVTDKFNKFVEEIRKKNPFANRAQLIVKACVKFYNEGYNDAVKEYWESYEGIADEEENTERQMMEGLGL